MSHLGRTSIAAALLALALPGAAGATDYCVAPNDNCGGTNVTTFEEALDLAQDDANSTASSSGPRSTSRRRTRASPTTGRTRPWRSSAPGGIARSSPPPPRATAGACWSWEVQGSSVRDLRIKIPQQAQDLFWGLQTTAHVKRVDIVEDPLQLQANTRAGVTLYENGTFEDSTAKLSGPGPTVGIVLGSGTVRGSALSARTGIYSHGNAQIERSRLTGVEHGLVALGSLTTIDESLVEMTGPKGAAIRAETTDGNETSVVGHGLTVNASDGLDTSGVAVTTSPKPAYNAHVSLANSVIRGGGTSMSAYGSAGGVATIDASYSDYSRGPGAAVGNAKINEANVTNVGDAGFVNAAAGDYRLAPGSPLIDAGDPGTLAGLDLAGNALIADGNGDGIERRDIGAYELAPAFTGGSEPPQSEPAADTQAPSIGGFRATPSAFAVARARTPVTARTRRGTRLRYTLSESARVKVVIRRAGRRGRRAGTLRRSGANGANAIRFSGRIGRRSLRAGRYRATIVATDAAGNRSSPRTINCGSSASDPPIGAPDPRPLRGHDARNHRDGCDQRGRADVLAQEQRGPAEREQRLDELDLPDLGHAASGQTRVPGEEAEQRADRGDVGEAKPGVAARVQVGARRGDRADRDRERQPRARAPSRSRASRPSRARARRPRRSRSRRARRRRGSGSRAVEKTRRPGSPRRPARRRARRRSRARSPRDGCSPARSTAATAVAAGSSPTITALCADVRS